MAENRALLFWSVWAAAAALATALPAAHLVRPERASPRVRPEPVSTATSVAAQPGASQPTVVEPAPEALDDRLLKQLAEARSGAERCSLCQQLPASEDPRITYAIASVLDHTRLKSLRACAATALSQQPTAEARSWLVDLVDDPQTEVHRAALGALAAANDDAARIIVIEATHSEDLEIRLAATTALLQAKRPEGIEAAAAVLPALEDRADLQPLIEALGESHDERALPVLRALIESADRESHQLAISALGELGSALSVPVLDALLAHGSDEEFDLAVQALRKIEPESVLAKLQARLSLGDSRQQRLAFRALLHSDAPEATALMHDRLRAGDPYQQHLIVQHLARNPDAGFEAELGYLATQTEGPLRDVALQALRAVDTPSAHATVQRLEPSDEVVASSKPSASNRSLRAWARDPSESAQTELLHLLESSESRAGLSIAVASAPVSTVEQLLPRAMAANRQQRYGMISGLWRRGDPRFAPTLRGALADSDASIRTIAVRALVDLGDPSAASEVARLMRAEDAGDRSLAAELLSARSDDEATRELATLAGDSDLEVASSALRALDARAPELAQQLALRAFRAGDSDARQTLLNNLNGLRRSVSRSLNELALADRDDNVVLAAVQGFTALEGPSSAQQLLALVSDANRSSEVRVAAAMGLRQLGGPLARSNRALLEAISPAEESGDYTCDNQ